MRTAALVCPALNILRAMELNLNGCDCVYKGDIGKAIDNLLKLMEGENAGDKQG